MMSLDHILLTITRITGTYYFLSFIYSLGMKYEYYIYKGKRKYTKYKNTNISTFKNFKKIKIAIIIPAYKEEKVIGRTLDFLVKAINNYDESLVKIFVGTYPNDEDTRKIVKKYEKEYSYIEEVLNPKQGPTTKAQNLNNIYNNAIRYKDFQVVGIHDAEDIIPDNILEYVNFYFNKIKSIDTYAGIQFGVRAKEGSKNILNLIYLLMLKSTNFYLTGKKRGFIPSHGTATYYKKNILDEILSERGYIWDERNFTEDFELSLYLYFKKDKTLLYVPYPYVEEYFPEDWKTAIRQISRWQYGALQSLKSYWKDILKHLVKNPTDFFYSSAFGMYSLSIFWIFSLSYILYTILAPHYIQVSAIENIEYTINLLNGIRWVLEGVFLYDYLNVEKEKKKALLATLASSPLSALANLYMIRRFLLNKRKIWTKTPHR